MQGKLLTNIHFLKVESAKIVRYVHRHTMFDHIDHENILEIYSECPYCRCKDIHVKTLCKNVLSNSA